MGKKHVTARVPDDIYEEIERVSEEEKTDKSTTVKRLLKEGIKHWKVSTAVERYRLGEVTISRAAEIADITIWEFMEVLEDQGVEPNYSEEDLERDLRLAVEEE